MVSKKVCAINHCKNDLSGQQRLSFHSFPKDVHISQKWVKFANNSRINEVMRTFGHLHLSLNYSICSNHFKPEDFVPNRGSSRRLLKYGVVPSLNLPVTSPPLAKPLLKTKKLTSSKKKHYHKSFRGK
ncbi:uncharacterized protein LOC107883315 isoform X1 [Acyrthosiphon pisum]|uniref:THAP-type domain-containing protein n=1 Tax=Acyrthosiphon pisum TaxID=7029 RepID=A0A8R2H6U2_ACYPI|nr:uncharacterized protein LOC107883315 isoform X1 [Acyrthosiphon pisum]|eukprot:XP_016658545.1 PREDICTED: uncharacterized protein LOC107883315 isoform X1 [Acyrthosiphon pisum]